MKRAFFVGLLILLSGISGAQKKVKAENEDTTIYIGCNTMYGKSLGVRSRIKMQNTAGTCPEFPGGEKSLLIYLANHIRYPNGDDVSGKVFVTMIIEKNGSIDHLQIARGLTKEVNDEAIRVLKAAPKWKPATRNGKAVRISYTIPVNFTITE